MIHYLVYLSSATQLYSASDIEQILTVSRKNNTERDVSGSLLYHEGSILQVLEGERQSVTDLYLKIKGDKRHRSVTQLIQGICEERNFADWSMGFKSVGGKDWSEYEGHLKLDKTGLLSLIKQKNPKVDATIKSFVNHTIL